MKKDLFDFNSYKKYVEYVINLKPGRGRGERTKLSAFVGCNTTYISQVLNGQSHFSLEQAERANRYFNHTQDESHFFILLVETERAGTKELKDYFSRQIQAAIEVRKDLKNRLHFKENLSVEVQHFYYSHWFITAIHLLTSMPQFQTLRELSYSLGIKEEKIQRALEEMIHFGFLTKDFDKYKSGATSIHLGSDSPLIAKHHINWRIQAIQNIEQGFDPKSLHYSSVITVAQSDIKQAREILVEAIEQIRKLVKDSKEDSLYCYNLDLFKVGR